MKREKNTFYIHSQYTVKYLSIISIIKVAMSKPKKSICKLSLDIGSYIERGELTKKSEKELWTQVAMSFNEVSPLDLVKRDSKDMYVCRMYEFDPQNCKRCPAYIKERLPQIITIV